MHPLLQKQIDETWGAQTPIPADFINLLDKVNRSYHNLPDMLQASDALNEVSFELHQAYETQKLLIDSATYAIIASDMKGITKIFNRYAEEMLGYKAVEVIDKISPVQFVSPESLQKHADRLSAQLGKPVTPGIDVFRIHTEGRDTFEGQVDLVRKDGSLLPVILSVSPRKNVDGEIIGYLGIWKDNQEELRMREKSHTAEMIIRNSPSVLFKWLPDNAWTVEYVSENVSIFGYSQFEFYRGKELYSSLIHPDDRDEVEAQTQRALDENAAEISIDYRLYGKSGKVHWVEERTHIERDAEGKVLYFEGVVTDCTERKAAEFRLKESELRYELAMQGSSAGVWDWLNLDQEEQWWSDRFYEMIGYTAEELPPRLSSFRKILHPDDVGDVESKMQMHLKEHVPFVTEYRLRTKHDGYRWFFASGKAHFNTNGAPARMVGSVIDIHERIEAEQRLRESEERYQLVVEGTSAGIWDWPDVSRDEEWWSPRFYELLGFEPNETPATYSAFLELVHPDDKELVAEKVSHHRVSNSPVSIEYRVRMKSGEYKWFLANAQFKKSSTSDVIRLAGSIIDIDARKKAEADLIRAKNEAEAAARAKSDFLSNMSHEIRTPMNAITGMTDLLLEKSQGDETREYLNSIKYSADNLLVIINDILDFSKIEAGKITFETIDFNLHEKLQSISRSFRAKAQAKNLQFSIVLDGLVPACINGDPFRLNQILFNLLGNAIKFTSIGSVVLEVLLVSTGKDDVRIRFLVRDTGIGIPEDRREIIFESFTQAYSDITRKYGGSGLGLAITKNLVVLQGGSISLHSEVDKGSSFTIELPFKKSATQSINPITMHSDQVHSLAGLRVLVVEDNTLNQFVIKQILNKWETKHSVAPNGREALKMLHEEDFDIVLMDLPTP